MVRVDDFPQTKGEPQHTLAAYREFDRCLREVTGGKRYLLGVIPGRSTVDDLLYLRNETDCVVGMHGTDHDEARLNRNGGNQFEPYLTNGEVLRQLTENRAALQMAVGRPVRIYMPPRNVIDWRTVGSLEASGFGWFTAGPETKDDFLRLSECIPSLVYGRTDELLLQGRDQHLIGQDGFGEGPVLTLHWTWETNIGLDHMRRFFERIPRGLFAHFDE